MKISRLCLLGLVLLASNANAEDDAGGDVKKPTEVKAEKAVGSDQQWRPYKPRDFGRFRDRIQLIKNNSALSHIQLPNDRRMRNMFQNSRIVGGVEAEENQWPWIVALFIDDAYFCGGSLITDKFVLTAAHCVDGASYFDIVAGAHNVRENEEDKRIEITSYHGWTHEEWDLNTLANDIALIELPQPLTLNEYIKPIRLPAREEKVYPGDLTTAIGWGRPSDSASGISPVLRMVENLPIISNKDCNDIYGIVGDGIVCIDTTEGRGTCNGDSGGPLMIKEYGIWTQVGLTSFGASTGCEAGYPDGFTRTEYYRGWIEDQVGPLD